MWPGENPSSAATGILDDVTYDWRPVVGDMACGSTPGGPVVAAEEQVVGHALDAPAVAARRLLAAGVAQGLGHAAATATDPDTSFGHFHDGAVTKWHHHPGGQMLFIVSGRGRVGTEQDGRVELEPGTLVVAPPNEAHWHGAAPGSDCTMLAVTWGTTCWHDEAPDLADF